MKFLFFILTFFCTNTLLSTPVDTSLFTEIEAAKKSKKKDKQTLKNLKISSVTATPSHSVLPKVDVISGTYIEEGTDLVVAGSEPLSLRRYYYHSAPADTRYGCWFLNPEAFFVANFEFSALPRFASVGELNGHVTRYAQIGERCYGLSEYPYSHLAANDQPHPLNMKIQYDKLYDLRNRERFIWQGVVANGTGSLRYFKSGMHHWHKTNKQVELRKGKATGTFPVSAWTPYHLPIQKERLPNGNYIVYTYTDWRNGDRYPWPMLFQTIKMYNSDPTQNKQAKLLGWLKFDYKKYSWKFNQHYKLKKADDYQEYRDDVETCTVTASDGRTVVYANAKRKRDLEPAVLKEVYSPAGTTVLDYDDEYLTSVQGAGNNFHTSYDAEGRVLAQLAPVGPNGAVVAVATYRYFQNRTDMTDAEGHCVSYHHDGKRILKVEKADCVENYKWDPKTGNLLCKTVCDSQGNTHLTQTYRYDANQNPIEEKNNDHVITRRYSNDGYNLLLEEKDGNKITRYSYVPNTNLVAAELICDAQEIKKRTFYFYDDCAICTKTIIDDGKTTNPNDFDVTYRKIINVKPKRSMPCFGLPEVVEERTLNAAKTEILVSRTSYSYTPFGKIASENHYDADGLERYTIYNSYDASERLVKTVDKMGSETHFKYDANNNLVAQIDAHTSVQITYDKAKRPTHYISQGKVICEKTYNKLGNITSETDEYGCVTHYNYDSQGRVSQIIQPDGGITQREYDPFGNLIREVDPSGYVTQKTYDFRGNPTHICHADGSEEHFRYNPDGTLAEQTHKNGGVTQFTYDIFGHVVKKESLINGKVVKGTYSTYSPFALLCERDLDGSETTYTNDFLGRKTSETCEGRTRHFHYDPLGRLTHTHHEDLVSIELFDLKGRLIEQREVQQSGQLLQLTHYIYDSAGNQVEVMQPNGTTFTDYDLLGRPIKQVDPLGNTVTFSYEEGEHGLIIRETAPDGVVCCTHHDYLQRPTDSTTYLADGLILHQTEYRYDLCGNCIETIDHVWSEGEALRSLSTKWSHGPTGRLEAIIYADGKKVEYRYNPQGQLATIIKADQSELHHRYDGLDRLSRLQGKGFHYRYLYDSHDRIQYATDGISHTETKRKYDAHGNLVQEQLANGYVLTSTYDHYGRRSQLTLPDRSSIQYTYHLGKLQSVSRGDKSFTYAERDLDGHMTAIEHPLGKIAMSYDLLGRLASIDSPFYHAALTYDACDRLVHKQSNDPLGSQNETYQYDALDQLISADDHIYRYDSLGNLLACDEASYIYDECCRRVSDGEQAYVYDACGNLISDGKNTYEYDGLDRLIRISAPKNETIFTYDPFNRRLTRTTKEQHYSYLWDEQNEIGAHCPGHWELRILGEGLGAELGASLLIEIDDASYFPVHDYRGSVIALIDAETQQLVEAYRYSAFGQQIAGGKLSPWRFASKRIEGDFVYFGRRYFAPHLEAWTTADPNMFEDGLNLYHYVHNDPISQIDLYGLVSEAPKKRVTPPNFSVAHHLQKFLLPFLEEEDLPLDRAFHPPTPDEGLAKKWAGR